MEKQAIDDFMSDVRVSELIEHLKVSDEFLDIVGLTENQHSSMLAWCLSPNEGHGLGDSVLKDFLLAAYQEGAGKNTLKNRAFFEKWTPATIRTASFGGAFVAREFSLRTEEGSRRKRLDLFVIDLQNKIVVTIENKAGALLNRDQLDSYYERVSTLVARRPVFKEFNFAYVVLDRELGSYDADTLAGLGNRWALLDYSWLEHSAKRARLHLQRNNQAAELLISYCEQQTSWQRPHEALVSKLSAELASSHENVVESFRSLLSSTPTEWVPSDFTGETHELLRFVQQHRQVCEMLVEFSGLAAVRVGILNALPHLSSEGMEVARSWLGFATPAMEELADGPDGYWPLYVNVYRHAQEYRNNRPCYVLRLIWCADHLPSSAAVDGGVALREHLAARFPALRKFVDRSERSRKLVIHGGLSTSEAVVQAVELARHLDDMLHEAHRRGIYKRPVQLVKN